MSFSRTINATQLIPMTRAHALTAPDPHRNGPLNVAVTRYEYDVVGNRTAVVDPLGRPTESTFDNAGRVLTVMLTDPDGGGLLSTSVTTYVYDALGRRRPSPTPKAESRSTATTTAIT